MNHCINSSALIRVLRGGILSVLILCIQGISAKDLEKYFREIPKNSQWAMSLHLHKIIDFLPGNLEQKSQMETRLAKAQQLVEKVSGVSLEANDINELIFFGASSNPKEPQGLLIKSKIDGTEFLKSYRERLLKTEELSIEDLPEPKETEHGFVEFRVKDEVALAEISPGIMAISKSPFDLGSLAKALEKTEESVEFLKGLPGESAQKQTTPLFSFFLADLEKVKESNPNNPGFQSAEGFFITLEQNSGSAPLELLLHVKCSDYESAELITKSAQGFKAITKLALLSKNSEKRDNLTEDRRVNEEIALSLVGGIIIKQYEESVILTVTIDERTTNKIRNSLFQAMNDKFGEI